MFKPYLADLNTPDTAPHRRFEQVPQDFSPAPKNPKVRLLPRRPSAIPSPAKPRVRCPKRLPDYTVRVPASVQAAALSRQNDQGDLQIVGLMWQVAQWAGLQALTTTPYQHLASFVSGMNPSRPLSPRATARRIAQLRDIGLITYRCGPGLWLSRAAVTFESLIRAAGGEHAYTSHLVKVRADTQARVARHRAAKVPRKDVVKGPTPDSIGQDASEKARKTVGYCFQDRLITAPTPLSEASQKTVTATYISGRAIGLQPLPPRSSLAADPNQPQPQLSVVHKQSRQAPIIPPSGQVPPPWGDLEPSLSSNTSTSLSDEGVGGGHQPALAQRGVLPFSTAVEKVLLQSSDSRHTTHSVGTEESGVDEERETFSPCDGEKSPKSESNRESKPLLEQPQQTDRLSQAGQKETETMEEFAEPHDEGQDPRSVPMQEKTLDTRSSLPPGSSEQRQRSVQNLYGILARLNRPAPPPSLGWPPDDDEDDVATQSVSKQQPATWPRSVDEAKQARPELPERGPESVPLKMPWKESDGLVNYILDLVDAGLTAEQAQSHMGRWAYAAVTKKKSWDKWTFHRDSVEVYIWAHEAHGILEREVYIASKPAGNGAARGAANGDKVQPEPVLTLPENPHTMLIYLREAFDLGVDIAINSQAVCRKVRDAQHLHAATGKTIRALKRGETDPTALQKGRAMSYFMKCLETD